MVRRARDFQPPVKIFFREGFGVSGGPIGVPTCFSMSLSSFLFDKSFDDFDLKITLENKKPIFIFLCFGHHLEVFKSIDEIS